MKKLSFILLALLSVAVISCDDKPQPDLDPLPEPEPEPEPVPYVFQDDSLGVFCKDYLSTIRLTISESEWSKLLTTYDSNPSTELNISASAKYEFKESQGTISNIGFRIKGNTSRRRPEWGSGPHRANAMQHAHFQIKSDEFNESNPKFAGQYKKIALKYAHEDPTYVREMYGYDLYRRFGVWTGAKGSYAKLYINIPEDREYYFGVYGMFEPIDKQYIKRRKEHFGDDKGNLWKCNWGSGLNERDPRHVDELMRLEDPTGRARYCYELKTNEDQLKAAQDQLASFIYDLNNKQGAEFEKWIESRTDIELLLRTLAVTNSIGQWDGYWGNSNNHYVYFNSKGKFFIIPYDLDNVLGTTNAEFYDSGRRDLCNFAPDNINQEKQRPLYYKVLQVSRWRKRYIEILKELHAAENELFHVDASIERIGKWHSLISPYLNNDTHEDQELKDRPASWGNHGEYRVYTKCSDNFFIVRSSNLPTR